MKTAQQQVRELLTQTITLLCKNGLQFNRSLRIEGLLGITVDDSDVFIVHIDENILGLPRSQSPSRTVKQTVRTSAVESPTLSPVGRPVELSDGNAAGKSTITELENEQKKPSKLKFLGIAREDDYPVKIEPDDDDDVDEDVMIVGSEQSSQTYPFMDRTLTISNVHSLAGSMATNVGSSSARSTAKRRKSSPYHESSSADDHAISVKYDLSVDFETSPEYGGMHKMDRIDWPEPLVGTSIDHSVPCTMSRNPLGRPLWNEGLVSDSGSHFVSGSSSGTGLEPRSNDDARLTTTTATAAAGQLTDNVGSLVDSVFRRRWRRRPCFLQKLAICQYAGCGKSFFRSCHLYRHQRIKHGQRYCPPYTDQLSFSAIPAVGHSTRSPADRSAMHLSITSSSR
jgi:hypothetical protein